MEYDLSTIKNEENRERVKKHLRYIELNKLSEAHKQNTFIRLRKILNTYTPHKDFLALNQTELEEIEIGLLKGKSWHTIHDNLKMIKKFVRVSLNLESNEPLPKRFNVFKLPKDKSKFKVFKDISDIIEPQKAFELVNRAKTKRDGFIFMILTDAGLRPHELRDSQRKDILKIGNKWYFQTPTTSKTGFRKIRLTFSIPYIEEYLKTIPEDPKYKLVSLSIVGINKVVKKLCGKNAYCLRHSSASFFANFLSEVELSERYGWAIGTKQTRVYIHLSQKQVDDKIDQNLDEKPQINELQRLKPKICLNCGASSNYNEEKCRVCKANLDLGKQLKEEKLNELGLLANEKLLELHPQEFIRLAESVGIKLVHA